MLQQGVAQFVEAFLRNRAAGRSSARSSIGTAPPPISWRTSVSRQLLAALQRQRVVDRGAEVEVGIDQRAVEVEKDDIEGKICHRGRHVVPGYGNCNELVAWPAP